MLACTASCDTQKKLQAHARKKHQDAHGHMLLSIAQLQSLGFDRCTYCFTTVSSLDKHKPGCCAPRSKHAHKLAELQLATIDHINKYSAQPADLDTQFIRDIALSNVFSPLVTAIPRIPNSSHIRHAIALAYKIVIAFVTSSPFNSSGWKLFFLLPSWLLGTPATHQSQK